MQPLFQKRKFLCRGYLDDMVFIPVDFPTLFLFFASSFLEKKSPNRENLGKGYIQQIPLACQVGKKESLLETVKEG